MRSSIGRTMLMLTGAIVIVVGSFLITTKVLDYWGTPGVILVRSATYGAGCGAPAGNVTDKVQSACGGKPSCDYQVDTGNLGDPAPGCGKDFSVEYSCNGNSSVQKATLPGEASGHSLHLACY